MKHSKMEYFRIKNYFYIILFLLLSCSGNKQANQSVPDWYLNSPKNNPYSIYTVGYGDSKETAIQIALNNASEQISTTISATTKTSLQEQTAGDLSEYETGLEQKIKVETKKINFTNYVTEKAELKDNIFYALVKISKTNLIENYQKNINKRHNKILSLNKLKTKNNITRLGKLLQIETIILANEADIFLARTIAKSNSNQKKSSFYQKLLIEKSKIINNLLVKISAKDGQFRNILERAFSGQKVKIVNNLASKNAVMVKLSTNISKQKIYNAYVVNVNFKIKLLDNLSRQISSNNVRIKSSSASSFAQAISNAGRRLEKKIAKKGILAFVGLQ